MRTSLKDLFSTQAELYAQYRPGYPTELFDFILRFVTLKDTALDCATGNGQVAGTLARHFRNVCAIDISRNQLTHAVKMDNIEYSLGRAEETPFRDNSFDLITVAQAYHWFDAPLFCREAARIGRPGAIVAVWVYDFAYNGSAVDSIVRDWNLGTLDPYWEHERKHVYSHYDELPFDFERIATPEFHIVADWTYDNLIGHLGTSSALQKMKQKVGEAPFTEVVDRIKRAWGSDDRRRFIFPIALKLGRVSK